MIFIWICPLDIIEKEIRYNFFKIVYNSIISIFNNVTFQDILLMDIFTSYAKIFGDMEITLCIIFQSGDMHFHKNNYYSCIQSPIPAILISLPFLFRLFQCLKKYQLEKQSLFLWNSFKYISALFVIFISGIFKKEFFL